MIISLTGFMGCGKSSVGRKLSTLLSCPYADLDSIIEEAQGKSVPEIFASDGEAGFRRLEFKHLSLRLTGNEAMPPQRDSDCRISEVLSLGGGTVMTPECAEIVHTQTLCIYLRAKVETLVSHLEGEAEGRPMLTSANNDKISPSEALRRRISELMSLRSATYEKTAHIIIDTDGKSIDMIAEEILSSTRQIISSRSCISFMRS